MTPEVSVVMSVFNGENHLGSALDSILMQEGVEFEVIVVDDGSTDGTGAILANYTTSDSRVRVIRQENSGLTRALITGCAAARGNFIARQDSGDQSLAGRLKAQVELLSGDSSHVLVVTGVRQIVGGGAVVGVVSPVTDPRVLTRLVREDMVGIPAHGCAMFRRDAYDRVGGYREEFYYAQDRDLWLRLASIGTVAGISEAYYDLDVEPGGISTTRSSLQRRFSRLAVEAHRERRRTGKDSHALARAESLTKKALVDLRKVPSRYMRAGAEYRLGALLEENGDPTAAVRYRNALRICPYYWRAWRKLV